MTENERVLRDIIIDGNGFDYDESIPQSIFEEIQQYRAIGTVEDLKSMKENGAFSGVELAQIACMQIKLKEYEAIGTIDEFKALKEKSVAKKAIRRTGMCYAKAKDGTDNYEIIEECPTCKKRLCAVSFNVGYCKCGQKITV